MRDIMNILAAAVMAVVALGLFIASPFVLAGIVFVLIAIAGLVAAVGILAGIISGLQRLAKRASK